MGCGDPSQTPVFRAVLHLTGDFSERARRGVFLELRLKDPQSERFCSASGALSIPIESGATVRGRRFRPLIVTEDLRHRAEISPRPGSLCPEHWWIRDRYDRVRDHEPVALLRARLAYR